MTVKEQIWIGLSLKPWACVEICDPERMLCPVSVFKGSPPLSTSQHSSCHHIMPSLSWYTLSLKSYSTANHFFHKLLLREYLIDHGLRKVTHMEISTRRGRLFWEKLDCVAFGVIWKILELCTRKATECYQQNLMGNSSRSPEDSRTERHEGSAGLINLWDFRGEQEDY